MRIFRSVVSLLRNGINLVRTALLGSSRRIRPRVLRTCSGVSRAMRNRYFALSLRLHLTQLSQLRTFFGFFVMIFVLKSCVFIVGI